MKPAMQLPVRGLLLLGLVLAVALGVGWQPAQAQAHLATELSADQVEILFFWGNGCPHCAEAEPFLDDLQARYTNVKITKYEVWYDKDNQALYQKMADQYSVPQGGRGVPFIIIGEKYWMGYSKEIGAEIETAVKTKGAVTLEEDKSSINVPLIGRVSLANQSLFVSTLLISFVDGVNPCSVWVLTMLLALTLHTGSRKKVTIIGLIFLTVTAGVYALFIAGLFTVFSVVSFIGWIQVVVSLVALFFGAVNIKDYFWYKEGISFTIDDEKKPGIYRRIRSIMDASQSFGGLAGATVVMAAGVSLVEFSCTAGFPVLWTNMLTAQKVTALTFILLLLVYLVIYQLDEMAIFFTAVYSLKASKLEEKHGRILKLIGGVLMLTLAGVMLINPRLMDSLVSSLVIFGIAFAVVVIVLVVHRKILPSMGIWIGTEAEGKKRLKHRRA